MKTIVPKNWRNLKAHPLADKLPEMSPEEYEALKLSIQAIGRITLKITLHEGMILDGRHRHRASIELGITPEFEELEAKDGSAVEFVASRASHRNLCPGQKAVVAEAFMDEFAAVRGKEIEGRSAEYAGSRYGVARLYVEQVRQIRKAKSKIYQQLRTGELKNVSQAFNRFRHETRSKIVRRVRTAAEDHPSTGTWKIISGDCVDKLEAIPTRSVKTIFTDPPYNIGLKYHGDKSGDALTDDDFVNWCCRWLAECVRVLAEDGSLFLMMPPKYAFALHNELAHGHGLHYRNTIAWVETFGAYQEGNLAECWRPILYFSRTANGVWNPDAVRIRSDRQAKYGDPRANPAGKLVSNVWEISRVTGTSAERVPFADAPPQLPITIPERCILLTSDPGDTVLDPFTGNGTTLLAAVKHGRKAIGIERSKLYAGQADQWIRSQLKSEGASK